MTNEEIFAMVEEVVSELWLDYGLNGNGYAECELDFDNVHITVEGSEGTIVPIFDDDISEFDDMSKKEIKDYLKDCMKEKFYDFDSQEEFEILGDDDISTYEYMKKDEKDFKEIAWLIEEEQEGNDANFSSFELALVRKLSELGKWMGEEFNPNVVKGYVTKIERLSHAVELYKYMKEKNIVDTKKSPQFYDENFFSVLMGDWQINAYWVEGKKDKAVEKFMTHVF